MDAPPATVYVIGPLEPAEFTNTYPVKIGLSGDPHRRVKSLQTGFPFTLSILTCFPRTNFPAAKFLETELHNIFDAWKLGPGREWFNFGSKQFSIDIIRRAVGLIEAGRSWLQIRDEIFEVSPDPYHPLMARVICPNCGGPRSPGANHCHKCHTILKQHCFACKKMALKCECWGGPQPSWRFSSIDWDRERSRHDPL